MQRSYHTGVKLREVLLTQKEKKIALVECGCLEAARAIQRDGEIECNFIYIAPRRVQDIELRMIRHRYGTETQASLKNKIQEVKKEVERVKDMGWITQVLVNDNLDRFTNKARNFIFFDLYQIR